MPSALIRRATLRDVPEIARIIEDYARQAILLPRTELELAENIREFHTAYDPASGQVLGCCALKIYTCAFAEVRSLAVVESIKGTGTGLALLNAIEAEARSLGVESLFAFTTVSGFFARAGYHAVDRARLPLKVWKDCLQCSKLRNCDEIAMQKPLRSETDDLTHSPQEGGSISPLPYQYLPILQS